MKIRLFCILLSLCIMLCACAGGGDTSYESSDETDVSQESIDAMDELYRQVEALLKNDREVTDLFVRGMLSGGNLTRRPTRSTRVYSRFDSILQLLDDTYASDDIKQYYLSYPISFGSSVYADEDGYTVYHYRHIDEKQIDYSNFSVAGDVVSVGDIHIPLIDTASGLRLGGSLYINAGETLYSPKGEGMDTGSAGTLKGNIFVLALYFGCGGDTFPKAESDAFRAGLDGVLTQIRDSAAEYGADISFTLREANFDHKGIIDLFEAGPYELEMIFGHTTLTSLDGLVKAEMGDNVYDGYLAVIVSHESGDAVVQPYEEGQPDCFKCERMIAAADTDADVLLGGIMQLFGADDCGYADVTAYRVGWTDTLPGQYINFIK